MTDQPVVETRDLRFRYPDGREALRGVTMSVAPGECVGLIGPNGAGKSTLLLHLNGILPDRLDDNGASVIVAGTALTSRSVMEIRRDVGLLFQDPDDQLFCPTVFEDVAYGPQQMGMAGEELKTRVSQALERVGMGGTEDRAPHHLSQGEKRRVCLAGVLACDPKILVLDEPTSNLDPRGRREFKNLLRGLPVTKILATHDLEMVVELCDRALVMDGGQIVVEGTPVDLLSDEPRMIRHGLERPHILLHRHPHGPPWRAD